MDYLHFNESNDDDINKPKRKYDSFKDLHNSIEVSGMKGMIRAPERKRSSKFAHMNNPEIVNECMENIKLKVESFRRSRTH